MKPSRSYSYFLQTVTSIALNFQPLVGVKRGKSVGVTPLSKLVAYTGERLYKLAGCHENITNYLVIFSSTVTAVGQLRRIFKKAAKNFPVYRIQVHKVLRGTEAILGERKRMTVLMPPTPNPTLRLQQDTTYIITGINIDNKLLFVDHNSIQTHSNELEDLIQTC